MKYDLAPIKSINPENIGGVCFLKIVPKEWILSESAISNQSNKAITATVLKAGRTWLDILSLYDSVIFTETSQSTAAGVMYSQSVVANVSGESELLNTLTNATSYSEFVLLIKDRMGNVKLVGNKSHGLTFSSQLATGMIGTEKNVYDISFQGESGERAPLYPF